MTDKSISRNFTNKELAIMVRVSKNLLFSMEALGNFWLRYDAEDELNRWATNRNWPLHSYDSDDNSD